ncbi:MAG TPA: hypothetical protein VFE25_07065 [Opitutaceae bacterium]|jgi:hypothetical protein|nr:hypothetical protein [Opitutaceae bacterium]
MANPTLIAERARLADDDVRKKNWKRWGPYLSERQWGTVREDYSADGDAWAYFTHEHARSRAYRWGEDGLLGMTDRECRLCFGVALWNGKDPFLKERLFGLTNGEGNHGEDVKEAHFYTDSTPTHSWMSALYKYPQAEFPYERLRAESKARTRNDPEFELSDTGIFAEGRYFDVKAEYAKADTDDICIRITVANRGPDAATLHLLPTFWFRNTWSWGCKHEGCGLKPSLRAASDTRIQCDHDTLGRFTIDIEPLPGIQAPLLFTENENNAAKLFGSENTSRYTKDSIHDFVVAGKSDAVNPARKGTKCSAYLKLELKAGEERSVRLRMRSGEPTTPSFGASFDKTFAARMKEADEFYASLPGPTDLESRRVSRQAYAGLLWSKQFYHYVIDDWLKGDSNAAPPPAERLTGRNSDWPQVFSRDVLSMPDKWEYPWFAAWDLAFHMLPMARLDPGFAKDQLNLLMREWYMHPNGQMPAYEWNFSDVNPPVHAWACWRVYKITAPRGKRDRVFLARVFQKLLVNFTWWVNRKDISGRNLFSGGFLGLDNVGIFDRSKPLPGGGQLEQADGTAWMAFYCSTMLAMALELADEDPVYEDIASKFFEHFIAIADAMNHLGGSGLWHEEDGFYYDQLMTGESASVPLRLRSIVGIIPLFAVEFVEEGRLDKLPGFAKRTRWFLENRKDLTEHISYMARDGQDPGRRLLAIPTRDRLERVLRYVFDENEFLSPQGIRSLSKAYKDKPFTVELGGENYRVDYEPAESRTWLFGGNSNWRGPVWFPLNYILIEALQRYHLFYGDSFMIEFPTGSGKKMNLDQIATELANRMVSLFMPDAKGQRPALAGTPEFANDIHWRDLLWFHEYFNGDTGAGLGANHQTGWTALVSRLIEEHTE